MAVVSLLIAAIQMHMAGWRARGLSAKPWCQFAWAEITTLTLTSSVTLDEL